MTQFHRRTAVTVAAAALLSAGVAGSVAVAAPHAGSASTTVVGGKTTIHLNAKSLSELSDHGFTLAASGKATLKLKAKTLTLPVTGGTYNHGKGIVKHTGGLTISKGSHSVTIKNVYVRPIEHSATAIVTGHGRITALAIGDPSRGGGTPHSTTYGGYSVTLSKASIKVLDTKFSTTLFKDHPKLGVGETTVVFKH